MDDHKARILNSQHVKSGCNFSRSDIASFLSANKSGRGCAVSVDQAGNMLSSLVDAGELIKVPEGYRKAGSLSIMGKRWRLQSNAHIGIRDFPLGQGWR